MFNNVLTSLYNMGRSLFSQPQQKSPNVLGASTSNTGLTSGGKPIAVPQTSTYAPTTISPSMFTSGALSNGLAGPKQVQQVTNNGGGTGSTGQNGQSNGTNNPQMPSFDTVDDSALNDLYGGAYSQLNSQQSALEGQLPLAISQLQNSGTDQKTPYDQKLAEGSAQLDQQGVENSQAESNAMQQARQLYNELTQFYNSRFGGGSSAGGAAQELLGRATAQNVGNIAQNSANNAQKIQEAHRQLTDFVTTQKASIDKQISQKTQEIQQWFRDQLNQINSSRATLESDKAGKRYEALQQRTNFVNQLKAQAYQYDLDMQKFVQEQMAAAQNAASGYSVPNIDVANSLIAPAAQGNTNVPRETQAYVGTNAQGQPVAETRDPNNPTTTYASSANNSLTSYDDMLKRLGFTTS